MLLLLLLLTATSYPAVTATGCSSGVQASADIQIYADVFHFMKHLEDLQIIRKIWETFHSPSDNVRIDLYGAYSDLAVKLRDYIEKNQALGAARYSVSSDDVGYEYVNAFSWQPPTTTKPTSHILILLVDSTYPVLFMKAKITKLKRAGWKIFTVGYKAMKEHDLDEIASFPAERHSYSRLNFHDSESIADTLIRSVCRSIEEKEESAKKRLLSQVRLVGGSGPCQGRVEVLYNNTWAQLSDEHWDRRAADVVCKQLKCGPSVEALKGHEVGAGSGHFLERVDCTGDERDISQCLLGAWTERDNTGGAGVTCLPSGVSGVRLVNGSGSCDGTVEVSLNNKWTRLCLTSFDLREGGVICKQMGCGPFQKTEVLMSDSPVETLDTYHCLGTESQFSQCTTSLWSPEPCPYNAHAGVTCSETAISKVTLVGERGSCSGKVKLFYNGLWSTVCASEWGAAEDAVVCKEMGCGPALEKTEVKKVPLPKNTNIQTNFPSVHCSGQEAHLSECGTILSTGFQCEFGEAETVCSHSEVSQVRLVDGGNRCSGRVEVYHNEKWGTVCDGHWDLSDAEVVCRQVGCGLALQAPGGAFFGPGSGDIWLEKVFCNGTESALSQCGAVVYREPICVHSQDASVICKEKST